MMHCDPTLNQHSEVFVARLIVGIGTRRFGPGEVADAGGAEGGLGGRGGFLVVVENGVGSLDTALAGRDEDEDAVV
jgi:hypothetical protein